MTRGEHRPAPAPRLLGGPLLVVAAMLITLPLVGLQGPQHTTPMDAVNIPFTALYLLLLLRNRDSLSLPLLFPFWLIMVASFGSLYVAAEKERALLVMAEDLYLYLWFATLAHFLLRFCQPRAVTTIWVAVAAGVAGLAFLDLQTGMFGGQFAAGNTRASGTFENPNMFGNYLVMSFFLAWATAAGGVRILYLAMPLLVVGILSTASNGALMCLCVGSAVTLLARPTPRPALRVGALLAAGGLALGLLGVFRDQVEDGFDAFLKRDRAEVGGAAYKGFEERLPVWLDTAELIQRAPSGVGPGNLGRERGRLSGTYHGAHNEYLGMLGERGPLGLLGWLSLLAGVGGFLWRMRWAAAAGVRPLAIEPLFGLFVAVTAHAFTIELSHFRHFWLGLAVLWAASEQVTREVIVRGAETAPARPTMLEAA